MVRSLNGFNGEEREEKLYLMSELMGEESVELYRILIGEKGELPGNASLRLSTRMKLEIMDKKSALEICLGMLSSKHRVSLAPFVLRSGVINSEVLYYFSVDCFKRVLVGPNSKGRFFQDEFMYIERVIHARKAWLDKCRNGKDKGIEHWKKIFRKLDKEYGRNLGFLRPIGEVDPVKLAFWSYEVTTMGNLVSYLSIPKRKEEWAWRCFRLIDWINYHQGPCAYFEGKRGGSFRLLGKFYENEKYCTFGFEDRIDLSGNKILGTDNQKEDV